MSGRAGKRARTEHSVLDVGKRELGQLSNRPFSLRFSASEDLLRRFGLHRKLKSHSGCVNTVSFNADGEILVSGADDRQVILWNWETGRVKLSFNSGHRNNVFQAKFMPFSDDHSIVTSAADGQVRHAKILESGGVETSMLGKHQGQVHNLAVEPGSPFSFYTCGEDGVVKHFDLRTRVATNLFTCKDTKFKLVIFLNAIAIDPRNPNLFAVGGMDEFARVYDIRSYRSEGWYNFGQPVDHFCPSHLIGDDQVGITGLAFSHQSELLASYNEENIYLFTRGMGLGSNPRSLPSIDEKQTDVAECRRASPQIYKGHKNCETIKGVTFFGPKSEYVVSGSDCGRIFIWRKDGELIRAMEADKHVVNCVESHPHMPLLGSCGIETDIKIWTPEGAEKATLPENTKQASISGHSRWFYSGYSDEEEGYLYNPRGFYVDYDDEEEDEESDTDEEDSSESSGDDDDVEDEAFINVDLSKIDDDCEIHNASSCGHAENNDVNKVDDDGNDNVEDEDGIDSGADCDRAEDDVNDKFGH